MAAFAPTYHKELYDVESAENQLQYIRERLASGKAVSLARALMKRSVKTAVLSSQCPEHYRVLSLGCGPGCEILAVMEILQSVASQTNLRIQSVEFTAVDQVTWSLDMFNGMFSSIRQQGPMDDFRYEFCTSEMSEFLMWHPFNTYDLIILSFADVKSKLDLAAEDLPRFLNFGGRILVLDNNLSDVKSLKKRGFRQERLLGGKIVCLAYERSL